MTLNEMPTIHRLADAAYELLYAIKETGNGFVADYCENALREIRSAMLAVIGTENGE